MELQAQQDTHGQERRRHSRLVLEGGEVHLPEGGVGHLVNASMNGIAFEAPPGFPFAEGDLLEINLRYKGQDIQGEAVIRHITRGLVGCEWLSFKDDQQRRAYYAWLMFSPDQN